MDKLSAKEVKGILDRNKDFLLINVLPEEHFRKKRIPGSVNVPLGDSSFLQRVAHLVGDKDAKVVVYCADAECNASPKAAEELEESGFRNVHDFEGGVQEWEQAGFPLEGEAIGA
jgi:rhodanese-related sulfurtransferase